MWCATIKIGVVVIGVCAIAGTLFTVFVWEPADFSSGTFAHWLHVPDAVDSQLLWKPCVEPVYSRFLYDGDISEAVVVAYRTAFDSEHFTSALNNFAQQNNCEIFSENNSVHNLSCAGDDFDWLRVYFDSTRESACTPILIDVYTAGPDPAVVTD